MWQFVFGQNLFFTGSHKYKLFGIIFSSSSSKWHPALALISVVKGQRDAPRDVVKCRLHRLVRDRLGRLGQRLVGTPAELVQEQDALLDALGLPAITWRGDADQILGAMKKDKKARAGNVRFTLPADVGNWSLLTVEDDVILEQLAQWKGNA